MGVPQSGAEANPVRVILLMDALPAFFTGANEAVGADLFAIRETRVGLAALYRPARKSVPRQDE